MQVDVDIDTAGLDGKSLREQKRLAFNVAQALNNVGRTAQTDVRTHMQQVFQLRANSGQDRKFLLDRIKLAFASVKKDLAFVTLYVDQSKKRLLLAGYEDGSLRTGFVGANVAVPNPSVARIGGSVAGAVDPQLTFKKLNLKRTVTKSGAVQWKGKQRTFEAWTPAAPKGAVFQRFGPGRDDIRIVYKFDAPFHLKRMLEMVDIASATMRERWPIEWTLVNARNPSK